MGKMILIWGVLFSMLSFGESVEATCLACHKTQQIPNTLIYRRYLMKYSTSKNIEDAMVRYLRNPQKEHSIMPPQFFLKFPMKKKHSMDERTLRQSIDQFIQKFDIKKKLVLDKNSH